jgi:hypothetical protein
MEIDLSYSYVHPTAILEKLKQVKYVINLPFFEDNSLETHRIHRALSAGCEVVSLYSKDKYANKQYDPYVHFVKELSDFPFLLELERKGNYTALMEDFGIKAIESNLKGILHAEKIGSIVPIGPVTKPTVVEEVTDFKAMLEKKKLMESAKT